MQSSKEGGCAFRQIAGGPGTTLNAAGNLVETLEFERPKLRVRVTNRPYVGATLPSLGETEANSAGEQLAEGYPSRAVTGGGRICPGCQAERTLRICPPNRHDA